jgi:hypothetical protein
MYHQRPVLKRPQTSPSPLTPSPRTLPAPQVVVDVSGADYISYSAEWARDDVEYGWGDCNATTVLPTYKGWNEAWELKANTSTKIEFVCGFKNESVAPLSVSFTGYTAAGGERLTRDTAAGDMRVLRAPFVNVPLSSFALPLEPNQAALTPRCST